jgi:hypothetical protein
VRVVTEGILGVLSTVVRWLLDLLPDLDIPEWMATPSEGFVSVVMGAGDVGHVIPIPVLAGCLAALFAGWWVAFGMRLVRVGVSHFTGGGGAS